MVVLAALTVRWRLRRRAVAAKAEPPALSIERGNVLYHTSMDSLDLNPDPRLKPAPSKTTFDYAMIAAKAATTVAFPFLSPGVTFVDLVTAPLRSKRLSDWCEELRLALNDLSLRVEGLTPEKLAEDEAFVSAAR